MLNDGKSDAFIATVFVVSVQSVKNAKWRWGMRKFPSISDEELDALIFTYERTFGDDDGYVQLAAHFRSGLYYTLRKVSFYLYQPYVPTPRPPVPRPPIVCRTD